MKPTRRTFMQTLGLLPFFRPKLDPIKMRPPVEKVLNVEPVNNMSEHGEMINMGTACTMEMPMVQHIVTTGDEHGLPTVKRLNPIDPTGQSPIRPPLDKLPKQAEDKEEDEAPWDDTGVPMG
jgi:hypothetical protein